MLLHDVYLQPFPVNKDLKILESIPNSIHIYNMADHILLFTQQNKTQYLCMCNILLLYYNFTVTHMSTRGATSACMDHVFS